VAGGLSADGVFTGSRAISLSIAALECKTQQRPTWDERGVLESDLLCALLSEVQMAPKTPPENASAIAPVAKPTAIA
jgi:hypothetical protein